MVKLDKIVSKEELDSPVFGGEEVGFFQKGKIRVVIIFEDNSHKDYYVRLGQSYFFKIGKAFYLIVPKCISQGKHPTIMYFYNNPLPVDLSYQTTSLTALHTRTKTEIDSMKIEDKTILAHTFLDAQSLKAVFDNRLLNNLYASDKITTRTILIILGALTVCILIVLHFLGYIDLVGWFTGGSTQ